MRGLVLCLLASPAVATADPLPDIPFQTLTLDRSHASLTASVSHLGLSDYTFTFDAFDATLAFGTDRPHDAHLSATIIVGSLDLPAPPDGFRETLLGPDWLDAVTYPQITFSSDTVETTGENTGTVQGTLSMLGQTAPVEMQVTFNGGYADAPWEPFARVGFSVRGAFNRSDLGLTIGLPAPGTTLGVGDEIRFVIEAEFVGTASAPE